MFNAQKSILPQPVNKRPSRAMPYYFYFLGVIAAIGSALLVIAAEVQYKTHIALSTTDWISAVF